MATASGKLNGPTLPVTPSIARRAEPRSPRAPFSGRRRGPSAATACGNPASNATARISADPPACRWDSSAARCVARRSALGIRVAAPRTRRRRRTFSGSGGPTGTDPPRAITRAVVPTTPRLLAPRMTQGLDFTASRRNGCPSSRAC